jgi:hypothetical protein
MATLSVGNLLVTSFETAPAPAGGDTTLPYSPYCCTEGNSGCDTNREAGCTDVKAGCWAVPTAGCPPEA